MSKIISKIHLKGATVLPQKGEIVAKHFSDAEIIRRAKNDPEAQPLTERELSQFKRVIPLVDK